MTIRISLNLSHICDDYIHSSTGIKHDGGPIIQTGGSRVQHIYISHFAVFSEISHKKNIKQSRLFFLQTNVIRRYVNYHFDKNTSSFVPKGHLSTTWHLTNATYYNRDSVKSITTQVFDVCRTFNSVNCVDDDDDDDEEYSSLF